MVSGGLVCGTRAIRVPRKDLESSESTSPATYRIKISCTVILRLQGCVKRCCLDTRRNLQPTPVSIYLTVFRSHPLIEPKEVRHELGRIRRKPWRSKCKIRRLGFIIYKDFESWILDGHQDPIHIFVIILFCPPSPSHRLISSRRQLELFLSQDLSPVHIGPDALNH
jgi:hypothetical protein